MLDTKGNKVIEPIPFAGLIELNVGFIPASLDRAIAIAASAHAGQVDKAGEPYILHPLRVMLSVPPEARIAAVLHDVLEDSDISSDDLLAEGFSPENLAVLDAVSRRPGESYHSFIVRCSKNPLARIVKLADLRDNCDMSRLANPSLADWARYEKYMEAIVYLRGDELC